MKYMMKGIMTAALVLASAASNAAVPVPACNDNILEAKPDAVFVIHDDGTVSDKETGLMWMRCSLGQSGNTCTGAAGTYTWSAALAAVQVANAGVGTNGYTDWRLPSAAELGSLVESACYNPSINTLVFPATVGDGYWTSSPALNSANSAWVTGFYEGVESVMAKSTPLYVRLVRE